MQKIMKSSQFVPVITLPHDTDPKQTKYEAWQKLRDAGMSCEQIAGLFNAGLSTVYNHTTTVFDRRDGLVSHLRGEARKAYYIPLMEKLRERGYSNVDIGNMTGFHVQTVRRYIGTQPDEITLASYRSAGAKRRFRNTAQKNMPARAENKPIPAVADVLSA